MTKLEGFLEDIKAGYDCDASDVQLLVKIVEIQNRALENYAILSEPQSTWAKEALKEVDEVLGGNDLEKQAILGDKKL